MILKDDLSCKEGLKLNTRTRSLVGKNFLLVGLKIYFIPL